MIDSLFVALVTLFITIISLYKWIIIVSALLSWVQPDPYNPIVQILTKLTEPAYAMVRKFIPTVFGGMDMAPLILIFAIQFLEIFVQRILYTMM
jgi:YggT family protein